MHISTKGRYALIIMMALANNYRNDSFLTLNEIAKNNRLSLKYLEKIMSTLKNADYFESSRGVSGGYKLKYDPSHYKIGDIIRLVEGNIEITDCVKSGFSCPAKKSCKTYGIWNELNDLINDYLDSKTLNDLF